MIKVVLTGAECSGKTTLAEGLAHHYQAPMIPEYSRKYLSDLDRPYVQSDLRHIAIGQLELEKKHAAEQLIICDTSMLVIKVWSQVKYNAVHPWLTMLYAEATPDLYLLPHWDIPYQEDSLREHPNDRKMLYDTYVNELSIQEAPWITVTGSADERLEKAVESIDEIIEARNQNINENKKHNDQRNDEQ